MSDDLLDESAREYLTARGYESLDDWADDRGFGGPADLLRDLLGCEMERGWA